MFEKLLIFGTLFFLVLIFILGESFKRWKLFYLTLVILIFNYIYFFLYLWLKQTDYCSLYLCPSYSPGIITFFLFLHFLPVYIFLIYLIHKIKQENIKLFILNNSIFALIFIFLWLSEYVLSIIFHLLNFDNYINQRLTILTQFLFFIFFSILIFIRSLISYYKHL